MKSKIFWQRKNQNINKTIKTIASLATSSTRTTHLSTISYKTISSSTESGTTDAIIDDAVEFVTRTRVNKSHGRKNLVASKHDGDRKIPEIDDPAVEEKMNRLTVGPRGNIRQNSKQDKMSSMKNVFARSRGKFRANERSKANIREITKDDKAK